MKYIIIFIFIFISKSCLSQNSWTFTKEQTKVYTDMFDNMPIKIEDINTYYKIGLDLIKNDSLIKAGMIMDRIHRLDSIGITGKKAYLKKRNIESKLRDIFKEGILGYWNEFECIDPYGGLPTQTRNDTLETIQIFPSKIIFKNKNGKMVDKSYSLDIQYDWLFGSCIILLNHNDNNLTVLSLKKLLNYVYSFKEMVIQTTPINYNKFRCFRKHID